MNQVLEIAADGLTQRAIRNVYQYWLDKRRGRPMPTRADIDALDVGYALGNISLVDVVREPRLRFRFRLDGSNLVALTGFDLTNTFADEFEPGPYRDFMLEVYRRIVAGRAPLFFRHQEQWQYSGMQMESATLPLSLDGENVDMIMDVVFPTEIHRCHRDRFRDRAAPDRALCPGKPLIPEAHGCPASGFIDF